MNSNRYLISALRTYRIQLEGQFGETSTFVVQETQDAADEIERLNTRVAELEAGLVVNLDGNNSRRVGVGMVSQRSWKHVAKLLEVEEKSGGNKVVQIVTKPEGLLVVWE